MKNALLAFVCTWAVSAAFACDDPSDVSEAYYSAVIAGDYSTSARMFHPDGISELRSRLDFLYETDDENLNNFWSVFGDGAEPSTVRSMTDLEFFEVLHSLTTEQATAGELMRLHKYEVVGTVMEDDNTAHVLVRLYTELTLEGKANFYARNKAEVYFDVQSMQCLDDRWMIEKDDVVEGLVFALELQNDLTKDREQAEQNN